jgi:hypothetical protein
MKKTNKVKMGPLGTPLGNPLGYFNSQKAKRSVEPKQTLRKAQNGLSMLGTKDNPNKLPPTLQEVGIKNTGIYQGPISERDTKALDAAYPSTAPGPYMPTTRQVRSAVNKQHYTPAASEAYTRNRSENFLRSDHPFQQTINKYPNEESEINYIGNDTKVEAEDRKMQDGTPYKKKGGTHKMPNGKVMLNSKMKKGGATKATKFAALAPPYNKATFADRIVGAKKNARKKK